MVNFKGGKHPWPCTWGGRFSFKQLFSGAGIYAGLGWRLPCVLGSGSSTSSGPRPHDRLADDDADLRNSWPPFEICWESVFTRGNRGPAIGREYGSIEPEDSGIIV